MVAWADARRGAATWAVAFSGGADSLALLLVAVGALAGAAADVCARCISITGCAERESRADAVFCRRVCAALGVEFVERRVDRARAAARAKRRRARRGMAFSRRARARASGLGISRTTSRKRC